MAVRVIVHFPARVEPDPVTGETIKVPESIAAFRMSRIYDLQNPLTGETTAKEQVAAILVEQAKAEFPDHEVTIEYFHDHGDTASWEPEPPEVEAAPGEVHEHELTAGQAQQASTSRGGRKR